MEDHGWKWIWVYGGSWFDLGLIWVYGGSWFDLGLIWVYGGSWFEGSRVRWVTSENRLAAVSGNGQASPVARR